MQAKINDTVTATFLVDTGSSANFISQAIVDKLGLKPQITTQIVIPFLLEGKQATFVSPENVLIGSLTLQGGAYIVLSSKALATMTGEAVDGILSMQMLRYFAIDLDFPRHQMTLWIPNALNDEAVKQVGFSNAFTVPLISSIPDLILNDPAKAMASAEAYWNLKYFVPVQIGDGVHVSQQNLLLDTGSGITIFPAVVSESLHLKVQEAIPLPKRLFGSQRGNFVQAPNLQIGGLHFVNHTVGILQSKTEGSGPVRETGILGIDALSGYRALIDFGAKKMYIKSAVPQIRIGAPLEEKP